MSLVLDTTLGGASSNSYVTLDEANTYFASRLDVDKWTDAQDDDRNRALVQSTRRIDYEKFYGYIVDDAQALEFPRIIGYVDGRNLDNIIPKSVKEATFELAIFMMSTDMSQIGDDNTGLSEYSVKVGNIQETKKYIKDDNVNTQDYNELPPFVTSLLDGVSMTVTSGGSFSVGR